MTSPSPPHDNAYKHVFSHPDAVRQLLSGFVHEDWVAQLDYSTLEKVSGSYVSDDLTVWIRRLVLRRFEPMGDMPELDDLPEVHNMISERIDSWGEQIRQQGMQQGKQQGLAEGERIAELRIARSMLALIPDDGTIAAMTGLPVEHIAALRNGKD